MIPYNNEIRLRHRLQILGHASIIIHTSKFSRIGLLYNFLIYVNLYLLAHLEEYIYAFHIDFNVPDMMDGAICGNSHICGKWYVLWCSMHRVILHIFRHLGCVSLVHPFYDVCRSFRWKSSQQKWPVALNGYTSDYTSHWPFQKFKSPSPLPSPLPLLSPLPLSLTPPLSPPFRSGLELLEVDLRNVSICKVNLIRHTSP